MILSANDCLVLPQWPALVGKETTSPREFILYNVDDCFSDYRGAIRVGHWKYIQDVTKEQVQRQCWYRVEVQDASRRQGPR